MTIASAAPFIIIITCTIVVLIKFISTQRKFYSQSRNRPNQTNQEKTMIILMLSLSILFLVTTLPICIFSRLYVFRWREKATDHGQAVLDLWEAIVYLMMFVNNAANFAMYYLTAPAFRTELRNLFTCGHTPQRASGNATTTEMQKVPAITESRDHSRMTC